MSAYGQLDDRIQKAIGKAVIVLGTLILVLGFMVVGPPPLYIDELILVYLPLWSGPVFMLLGFGVMTAGGLLLPSLGDDVVGSDCEPGTRARNGEEVDE